MPWYNIPSSFCQFNKLLIKPSPRSSRSLAIKAASEYSVLRSNSCDALLAWFSNCNKFGWFERSLNCLRVNLRSSAQSLSLQCSTPFLWPITVLVNVSLVLGSIYPFYSSSDSRTIVSIGWNQKVPRKWRFQEKKELLWFWPKIMLQSLFWFTVRCAVRCRSNKVAHVFGRGLSEIPTIPGPVWCGNPPLWHAS
jgi:hypothetical protein